MRQSINIFTFLIIILFFSCKDKDPEPVIECSENCFNLSDLETRQDKYLPFSLVNDNDSISSIILNNEVISFPYGGFLEFNENGFNELILIYKDQTRENDTILFTTKTEEREAAEWGIRAWVPLAFETSVLGSETIELFYPHRYTDGIKVPFIFYIREGGERKAIYLNGFYPASDSKFFIKQGVGSINLSSDALSDQVTFDIGGRSTGISLSKTEIVDMELNGSISSNLEIPANSVVKITGNLNISAGSSLTVHEGTVILIDEAVNINHQGPINFLGTSGNPVFVTCSNKNKFWGGFITSVSAGEINAQYTIFCQSGYHNSSGYNWGHAQRQALFYTENSTLTLDHCFMLDHIGQIFYPQNATLNLHDILVQRAKTSGQLNYTEVVINNSIFTDFPDDSLIYADNDNDALYLSATNATINNSVFMFAKDDGLDSGGDEGGTVTVTNCRFESCFHEGAALSSRNMVTKNHTFQSCIFTNCGQGIELGFSTPNHTVIADNCQFYRNGIGIRYGDNYDWSSINGKMFIKNSTSRENDKDVWNMVRMDWHPKLDNLNFENTFVSKISPQYPNLKLIGH